MADEKELPDWLSDWTDDVASCWENEGLHLGTKHWIDGDGEWWVQLRLLPVKLKDEGDIEVVPSTTIDLAAIIDLFDEPIDGMTLRLLKGELFMCGKVLGGTHVNLELIFEPTEEDKPVQRIDGATVTDIDEAPHSPRG